VFSGAMAKTLILSLFLSAAAVYLNAGWAAAVDLNVGVPKPHPSIDTDKYETVADKREIALYQRHTRQTCSYPNSTFGCADIHEDIKATVSTLRCLVCDYVKEDGGLYYFWRATFCAKDGSSHVRVSYTDKACQNVYANTSNPEGIPVFQNSTARKANPGCFTGLLTPGSNGCTLDLYILWPVSEHDIGQCAAGQCSASHPAPLCQSDNYCDQPDYCGYPTDPPSCDTECCTEQPSSGESIAAYQWWFEFRPSRYVCDERVGQCVAVSEGGQAQEDCQGTNKTCKKSQYECKNNQCVEATSGGGNYDQCLKFCGSITV